MAQYFPEILITSISSQTRRLRDDSLGISTEGPSVPYFPDRTMWYLFYYTNRDLGDEVIG